MKKTRITAKKLVDFLNKIADVKPSELPDDDTMCYYSKIDGSFITFVGMEKHIKYLLKRNIIEQMQNCQGIQDHTSNIEFNPVEKKWYGWSHRAMYGFGIGSTCKKGDCHYNPFNKKE